MMLRTLSYGFKKTTSRCLPMASFTDIREKGIADEKVYFNRQEADLMKSLLAKMHKQADTMKPSDAKTKEFCDDLRHILKIH